MYVCDVCSRKFEDLDDLDRHSLVNHRRDHVIILNGLEYCGRYGRFVFSGKGFTSEAYIGEYVDCCAMFQSECNKEKVPYVTVTYQHDVRPIMKRDESNLLIPAQ